MTIELNNGSELIVHGTTGDMSVYHGVKDNIRLLIAKGHKDITIKFVDAVTITSAMIGYFIKAINLDGVRINVHVTDSRLYEMLNMMNLVKMLNVKKI